MIKRPLYLGHDFLAEVIRPTDTVVDATMGNGNDTLFLARLAGKVHAFDIQEQALEKTAQRLQEAGVTNVDLHLAGHEDVDQYVSQCQAAIFNLGYLPSADKSVITLPETTLIAIQKLLKLLTVGGRMAIVVYHGHQGGDTERDAVLEFVSQLPQESFTVMSYRPLNQKNNPPFLLMIEKLQEIDHETN